MNMGYAKRDQWRLIAAFPQHWMIKVQGWAVVMALGFVTIVAGMATPLLHLGTADIGEDIFILGLIILIAGVLGESCRWHN